MAKSFLQSKEWAALKARSLWRTHTVHGVTGLSKQLPLGVRFIYFPEMTMPDDRLKTFVKEVRDLCVADGFAFARLEFFDEFKEIDSASFRRADTKLRKLSLKKSPEEMQPEHRQLIDLTVPIDKILAQMKSKGRYNAKLAERKGVVVQPNDDTKIFHALYAEAAKRDGFTPRPKHYFDDLMSTMGAHAQVYIAWLSKRPLAGALIIFWQGRASYLYGGSATELRNVMAPSLLHFEIMRDAKKRGMKTYDMLAIAPPPDGGPHHKYAGLRRFKEQFGGESIGMLGSYDLIINPMRYTLFNFIEKLRGRW